VDFIIAIIKKMFSSKNDCGGSKKIVAFLMARKLLVGKLFVNYEVADDDKEKYDHDSNDQIRIKI
jgi:hypothetical protein